MYQIDNATALAVMPTPGAAGPIPDGYFKYGTLISQDWLNAVQQEFCNVITNGSVTLDKTDRTQLYEAIINLIDAGSPAPGIMAIVEDTDPHLGGDLDVNGFDLLGGALASDPIELSANGTGYLIFNTDVFQTSFLVHRGDTNNYIGLEDMEFYCAGSLIFDISSSPANGFRLGGANSRVSSFYDEDNMASNSQYGISSQQAAKAYTDTAVATYAPKFNITLATYNQFGTNGSGTTIVGWQQQGNNINTSTNQRVVQRAGTVKNLYGTALWNSGNTNVPTSIVITLRKNNSNTALTITLGRTTLTASDTSNTVSVAAGDLLSFECVTNGAVTASTNVTRYNLTLEIE